MEEELKYVACIRDSHGKIRRAVSGEVTRLQAENILRTLHYGLWVRCEALPVLASTPGIHH